MTDDLKKIRSDFFEDLHGLLETHKRFINDSEYEDYQGDSWDFVLDDCQNLYVKWIIEFRGGK